MNLLNPHTTAGGKHLMMQHHVDYIPKSGQSMLVIARQHGDSREPSKSHKHVEGVLGTHTPLTRLFKTINRSGSCRAQGGSLTS